MVFCSNVQNNTFCEVEICIYFILKPISNGQGGCATYVDSN